MDKKLWKLATREKRSMNRLMMFVAILIGFMVLVVGIFIGLESEKTAVWSLGCLLTSMGAAWFWLKITLSNIPSGKQLAADNPVVLKIILTHLQNEVLAPKWSFVDRVKNDIEALETDLGHYFEDRQELLTRTQVRDEQTRTINQSALLRTSQLIPLIKQRLSVLNAQIAEAETIVEPVVKQIAELEKDLNRLIYDERVAASLKALDKIDRKIPVNDQFLTSLRVSAERAKYALAELVADTKATQAAWSEVRLESTLSPEDEVHLLS